MNVPFTVDQFLSVFQKYNQAVWPMQIVLNLLGVMAVGLAIQKISLSNRIIAAILAFFWLWIGVAYHFAFFTKINPAAYAFAVLNIIQGILFLYFGVVTQRISFHFRPNALGATGALMIVYAMMIYPVLGSSVGHAYPKAPTFGLPCPTTIFTLGLLLWTDKKFPNIVLIIPVLWGLIGFTAALSMGILEDTGLLLSALLALMMISWRGKKAATSQMGSGEEA